MRSLNLVPWRERQRRVVLLRWQLGVVMAMGIALVLVRVIDQVLVNINQAHLSQTAAWLQQQQVLQSQLHDASLWQTRERQAQQLQSLWPHWHRLQTQAWQAFIGLLSASPQGVQISHAEWRDGQWRLQAKAFSAAQMQQWQAQLLAQGIAVQIHTTPSASAGWRCPQGRWWRLQTYELRSSTSQRGQS
jgi:hypothetical protein